VTGGSLLRDLRALDRYRAPNPLGDGDEGNGAFQIPSPVMGTLRVIASNGDGWDHVSVSTETRMPTWTEMEHVKRMFFREDAVAMQLHVPPTDHVNIHPHCLHLWRPHAPDIPLPPVAMV
jgi:hypothetical protein